MKLASSFLFFAAVFGKCTRTVRSDGSNTACNCNIRHLEALHTVDQAVMPTVSSSAEFLDSIVSAASLADGMDHNAWRQIEMLDRELQCGSDSADSSDVEACLGVEAGTDGCCTCQTQCGILIPLEACCGSLFSSDDGSSDSRSSGGDRKLLQDTFKPFSTPRAKKAVLLAEDPGLWLLPEFLDPSEIRELRKAIKASSDFSWDCKEDFCKQRQGHDICMADPSAKSMIQPGKKDCLLINEDVMADLSKKNQDTFEKLRQKFEAVWPEFDFTEPLNVQAQEGKTEPFKYHIDGEHLHSKGIVCPVSLVLYLSNGGSQTLFPYANSTGIGITPEEGTAITWFNVDENFLPLASSAHGVQASPEESGIRMVVSNKYTVNKNIWPYDKNAAFEF